MLLLSSVLALHSTPDCRSLFCLLRPLSKPVETKMLSKSNDLMPLLLPSFLSCAMPYKKHVAREKEDFEGCLFA